MVDVVLVVGGEAGHGVRSVGDTLARLASRAGYHVFAYPDVMSRIRGGHNFTTVRVADEARDGVSGQLDLLLALDEISLAEHLPEMRSSGIILVDQSGPGPGPGDRRPRVLPLPMRELARKHGGSPTMAGSVGLGAVCALLGLESRLLEAVLSEQYGRKGQELVRANVRCAQVGHRLIQGRGVSDCSCLLPGHSDAPPSFLMTGNHAIALGAAASGLRFFSGYPMSPATGIMEYLAGHQSEFGVVVEQVEDEISAICSAIGASYAGVRSMTATSGGGFSLMVEGLGLAAMTETPIVLVVAQRPGPATGLPTRTEQGDLLFAIHASQDEFPRFVFTPGDALQAFRAVRRAFRLAGRYQVPAIVLTDQLLSASWWTVAADRLLAELGQADDPAADLASPGWAGQPAYSYRRYAVNEGGVSSRLGPGTPEQLVCCLGSEHDELGLPSEDAATRIRMQQKRFRKTEAMAEAAGEFLAYPGENEDCVVVCFGSTFGAVRDAVEILRAERLDIGMIHLQEVFPFPANTVRARLARVRQVVLVENNSTGQLARLLTRETRRQPDAQIRRYDGRPFASRRLAAELRQTYRGRYG